MQNINHNGLPSKKFFQMEFVFAMFGFVSTNCSDNIIVKVGLASESTRYEEKKQVIP